MSSNVKKGRTFIWTAVLTIGIILLVTAGLSIYEQHQKDIILSEMTVSEEALVIPALEEGLPVVYPWEKNTDERNAEILPISDIEIDEAIPEMLLRLCTLFGATGDLSLQNLRESDGYYYHAAADENDISYAIAEKCVWAFAKGSASKRWDRETLLAAKGELSRMLTQMELRYNEADLDNPIYRFCEWYEELHYIYIENIKLSMYRNSAFREIGDTASVQAVRQALINTRSGCFYIRDGRLFLAYDLGETYLGVQFDPETFDIVGYQLIAQSN